MFEQHAITNLSEVPALVSSFATSIGWTAGVAPLGGVTLLAPGDDIVWTFKLSGSNLEMLYLEEDSNSTYTEVIDSKAVMAPPVLRIGGVDTTQVPDWCYLVGGTDPSPYLHIAVSFGDNLFRHMYVGILEKLGNYTHGNIIAATKGPGLSAQATLDYKEFSQMKYLFQGGNDAMARASSGGLLADHADNAEPWRTFYNATFGTVIAADVESAIGGFGDAINDGYLARAAAPFAGLSILAPINMYVTQPISGDRTFVPVGRVPGIRMVNMATLEPASEIVVGGFRWVVFPSHSRRIEKTMTAAGSGSRARDFETSYWVGYALAIGEEDSNS